MFVGCLLKVFMPNIACCNSNKPPTTYRKDYGYRGRGGFEIGLRCKACGAIRMSGFVNITIEEIACNRVRNEIIRQQGIEFDLSLS